MNAVSNRPTPSTSSRPTGNAQQNTGAAAPASRPGIAGTPDANDVGRSAPGAARATPLSAMPSASSSEVAARQQAAAAGVQRGLSGSSSPSSSATPASSGGSWLGGQSFEDLAAKFDKDSIKSEQKKGKVGSGTGVNHNEATKDNSASSRGAEPTPRAPAGGAAAAAAPPAPR